MSRLGCDLSPKMVAPKLRNANEALLRGSGRGDALSVVMNEKLTAYVSCKPEGILA